MLTELRITNFALIDRVSLEFSSGFHVLTGETGAGKSILVDAIALLVGGRASTDQIRTDAEEAVIEGAFVLAPDSPLLPGLREQGVLGGSDTELIIRRVLSRSGRHRIYLNGSLTPLHTLQAFAGTLLDIHGQHEQQSLLSAGLQLEAVDAFGKLVTLRRDFRRHYDQWQARRRALEEAQRAVEEQRGREELLRFQCDELDAAALRPGEDDALEAEHRRLAHAGRLAELSQAAYGTLYEDETAVLPLLGAVGDRLQALSRIDATADELPPLCEAAAVQLGELARRVRQYRDRLEMDPARLADVEERLERIQRLKKKYGETVDGLIAKARDLRAQLQAVESADDRLAELTEAVERDAKAVVEAAGRLSSARRRAASQLEKRVKKELCSLQMDRTAFTIELRPLDGDGLGPAGCERAEFLLSANPGEPLMPLSKIASGGELSRIMLALKSVLADADTVPVLIFDEIDAGVGGAVAAAMGERLRELGRYHQVLCITHLPQLASQADVHVLVEKTVEHHRTATRVKRLDGDERRREVARMLSGRALTPAVLQTATELLGRSKPR
ncbi:DNA repair protein RecN [Candidatus Nitrospira bockiana]